MLIFRGVKLGNLMIPGRFKSDDYLFVAVRHLFGRAELPTAPIGNIQLSFCSFQTKSLDTKKTAIRI